MKNIKTEARIIDEGNYNQAVAFLPAGFALRNKAEVLGGVIVINDLSMQFFGKKTPPLLVIKNSWMNRSMFEKNYRIVDPVKLNDEFFVEVERIGS